MTTNNIALYKFAAEAMNNFFDEIDANALNIAREEHIEDKDGNEVDEFTFEFEGATYTIPFSWRDPEEKLGYWDLHIYRGSDPTQYYSFQFNDDDEFHLGWDGYYSSWEGGDYDDSTVLVYRKQPVTDYYLKPVE